MIYYLLGVFTGLGLWVLQFGFYMFRTHNKLWVYKDRIVVNDNTPPAP